MWLLHSSALAAVWRFPVLVWGSSCPVIRSSLGHRSICKLDWHNLRVTTKKNSQWKSLKTEQSTNQRGLEKSGERKNVSSFLFSTSPMPSFHQVSPHLLHNNPFCILLPFTYHSVHSLEFILHGQVLGRSQTLTEQDMDLNTKRPDMNLKGCIPHNEV